MSKKESEVAASPGATSSSLFRGLSALAALTALVALLIAVLIGALIYTAATKSDSIADNESELVKPSQFQSVFLTNGQVYFGKLSKVDEAYYQLTDIFYLQVQQQVQPTGTDNNTTATTAPANAQGQTQLVKLGDELHGPEDSMQINRDQVQFWENLKPDGNVAKAIASYQNK